MAVTTVPSITPNARAARTADREASSRSSQERSLVNTRRHAVRHQDRPVASLDGPLRSRSDEDVLQLPAIRPDHDHRGIDFLGDLDDARSDIARHDIHVRLDPVELPDRLNGILEQHCGGLVMTVDQIFGLVVVDDVKKRDRRAGFVRYQGRPAQGAVGTGRKVGGQQQAVHSHGPRNIPGSIRMPSALG